jgi:Ca2+/Na+ antiporter
MLAFGGSAPDLFASIASSEGSSSEGIHMGIAVLCGSSLFMISFIAAMVIFAGPEDGFPLHREFLLRDSFFLLLAQTLLLSAIVVKGKLYIELGYTFILLYTLYVVVVILQDRWYK